MIILAVVQVVMLNKFSTSGERLIEINRKTQDIDKENCRLAEDIASSSSITIILSKAQSIGLKGLIETTSVTSPLPVAYFPKMTL